MVHRTFIFAAALFAFLSFLLYWIVPEPQGHFDLDSYAYNRIAHNFQMHGLLADPQDPDNAPIQTLGYPFVLGLIYWAFGHTYAAVIVVQILFALISMWLVMRIARRIYSPKVARIAIILCACNCGLLIYCQLLLAEIMVLTFLLAGLDQLTQFLMQPTYKSIVLAGFILGVSIIIKPIALLFGLVISGLLVWWRYGVQSIVFLTLFLLPSAAYVGYNYTRFGVADLAPMMQLNMYQCFLSKVIGRMAGKNPQEIADTVLAFKGTNSFDTAGWNDARNLFWEYLYNHPLECMAIWFENVAKTLFGLYVTQAKLIFDPRLQGNQCSFFAQQGSLIDRVWAYCTGGTKLIWLKVVGIGELIWALVRWLVVVLALLCGRHVNKNMLVLLSFYCVCCALVTGMDGCCRYRIIFEPILLIGAAAGLEIIWNWINDRLRDQKKEIAWRV